MAKKNSETTRNEEKMIDTKNAAAGASARDTAREADVLYQRLGGKWFAFSLIDDEMYFGSISEEQIQLETEK